MASPLPIVDCGPLRGIETGTCAVYGPPPCAPRSIRARIDTWLSPNTERLQLEAILEELRHAKTPIDNPRIERALMALIETLLEPGAVGAGAVPRSD